MKNSEKIYIVLCLIFCLLIVIENMTYQKFVYFPIFSFHTCELSVGAILYPLTFLITDLVIEFYGKEKTKFCVKMAIITSMLTIMVIFVMDMLPATSWSKINDYQFHQVFGFYSIAFTGSVIAFYTAQLTDIALYLRIRKLTKGKWLWFRNICSTTISLFLDTIIVITFLTFFEVLPIEHAKSLIINSYSFKLLFSIFSAPLFYLCTRIIIYLTKNDLKYLQA